VGDGADEAEQVDDVGGEGDCGVSACMSRVEGWEDGEGILVAPESSSLMMICTGLNQYNVLGLLHDDS